MNASVSKLRLADALHVAKARDASDLHLSPKNRPAIRVDGSLEYLNGSPLESDELHAIALQLLDERQIAEVHRGLDVSAVCEDPEFGLLRVHAFRIKGGIAIAIRLLHQSIPAFESLQLPAIVAALCERERGLILFAGPTGSGKSTSLASLVDRINSASSRHIITIEDPVEYRHASKRSLVVQRQIGVDAASFPDALIGALRADPDVIVVGEMRDVVTIRAALTAAETGHLVLGSIHTGDAVQTVDRIVDAFPALEQGQVRTQLAQALAGVVCQRLLPRACGRGRQLAAEILIGTDGVRNIIRESRLHQLRNAIVTGRQFGMQTLESHLSELVAKGEITPETAISVSDRHDDIKSNATVIA